MLPTTYVSQWRMGTLFYGLDFLDYCLRFAWLLSRFILSYVDGTGRMEVLIKLCTTTNSDRKLNLLHVVRYYANNRHFAHF